MSDLVGSLLVMTAIFVVLFGIKDILANLIRRFKFSNMNFMSGVDKRELARYRHSKIKTKLPARSRQSTKQVEENGTEIVNVFEDVNINYQPLPTKTEPIVNPSQFQSPSEAKDREKIGPFEDQPFRNIPFLSSETEPSASSVLFTDQSDEITLAIPTPSPHRSDEPVTEETYLYEDDRLIPEPSIPETRLSATPAPSPYRSNELGTEETYHYEEGKLAPETSSTETKLSATPEPFQHQSDEEVSEEVYFYEDGILVPETSSTETRLSAAPAPFQHQLDEKMPDDLSLYEDSISIPELAIVKTSQATTPVQSRSRSDEKATEKIALDEGGKAPAEPSITKPKPTATPIKSYYQSDEDIVEEIISDDEITISPEPLIMGTKPAVTLMESRFQASEKSAEDIVILDDMTIHLTTSATESMSSKILEEFYERPDNESTEDQITSEAIAVYPKPSSVQTKAGEPPESSPLQPDEKSTVDIYFQEEEKVGTTSLKTEKNQAETLVQFSHHTDKMKAEHIISAKDINVDPTPSPPEAKPTLILEHSRQGSAKTSNKSINLDEGVSPHRKPSTTKSSPTTTHAQFRSQPGKLDKSDVVDVIRNYDFHDIFMNPNGKGLSHRYTALELSGDEIIIDEATNLIWQQNGSTNDMTIESARKWLERLNRESYAGFQDWRFPTLEEAMSLMEGEKKNGDLFVDPLFNKTQEVIWTSDFLIDESRTWIVSLARGFCGLSSLNNNNYVRAVRQDENIIRNLIL